MSTIAETLTVCIQNQSDEARVTQALLSVAELGARVLIVDLFSEDQSFEALRQTWEEAGRRPEDFEFVTRKWPSGARMREKAAALVKTRWLLWLHSDEWIETDTQQWIQAHLEYLNPDHVYAFRRETLFLGRRVRRGGWYPDFQRRLYRLEHATWEEVTLPGGHATIDLVPNAQHGKTVAIDTHLGYLPYRDLAELDVRAERDAEEWGKRLAEFWHGRKSKPSGKASQFLQAASSFLDHYLLRAGFLDRKAGYHLAKGAAFRTKRRIEKARDSYWNARR
ncbi:MAG TPA: glycosyltransferase [Verrucomicrobiae bacterium]|nr:glycosyltransferase [Verrucomicrobiae bacterium]